MLNDTNFEDISGIKSDENNNIMACSTVNGNCSLYDTFNNKKI